MVVVGHSGAYRTIVPWLASAKVKEIVLLDGLYENEDEFGRWLGKRRPRKERKLVLVASETAVRSEAFCKRYRSAAMLPAIPAELAALSYRERWG